MTDQKPVPLPVDKLYELDLQFGRGLVETILEPGVHKIRELRCTMTQSGKYLPKVRTRDNTSLAPFSFLLHHNGRLVAEGEFATLGDILQVLSRTAGPAPPPRTALARRLTIAADCAVSDPSCIVIN